MKKITVLVAGLLSLATVSMAQTVETEEQESFALPTFYIGGGAVFNDLGWLGLTAEVPVHNQFTLHADVGVGSWGPKFGAGGSIYFRDYSKGHSLNVGISHAPGTDSLLLEGMPVEPAGKADVVLDLNPVTTLNIMYGHAWPFGKKNQNRFTLNVGYAVKVSGDYEVVTKDVVLSDQSKASMDLIMPGGLIFGGKFAFGLGSK